MDRSDHPACRGGIPASRCNCGRPRRPRSPDASCSVGNGSAELGELFSVWRGEAADGRLILEGDLRHVRRIGRGMASGEIAIDGDVGPGLGQGMLSGTISVVGAVGNSAGAAMRGGMIRIKGSAGDNLGGSDSGARAGMREGVILVEGAIGHDAGLAMRRGLIAVTGPAGDGLGRGMIAGSIFAFGSVDIGLGAGMKPRDARPVRVGFAPDRSHVFAERAGTGRRSSRSTSVSSNPGDSPCRRRFSPGPSPRYNGDRAAEGAGGNCLSKTGGGGV